MTPGTTPPSAHLPPTATPAIRAALRIEGAAIALCALWVYATTGAGWGVFALCLLLPDLAMLGYLRGPRVGALCYNIAHSYTAPLVLGALAGAAGQPWAIAMTSLWMVHIGADRALGYGLKLAAGFKVTHLGRAA
ncbi:DUF4260 domain-containing protein [Sulfitobacter sabulilitoris]|uniref:DUF4260 family protein n=1 Tax=Sulfitobacter sabulilitoris TaxID=2562655 RepID=A0A5S3PBD7_9RHOB|nr:DUF4260 domain-containing protein [Sulfitobacter sabulilitoris]TMM50883.1 DUF4260 family protein [Sulfitobacter sabulilitoris]